MGDSLRGHAGAGVRDRQQHVGSRTDHRVIERIRRVQIDVAGFNDNVAAVRQGVARIHDQIHDDLLDLTRIRFDCCHVLGHKCFHLDVRAHQPPEEVVEIYNDRVEVDDFRPQNLLPAEGE